MRILRHRIDGSGQHGRTPAAAALAPWIFAEQGAAFWLDTGVDASSGRSYLGVGQETITSSPVDGRVTSDHRGSLAGTVLDVLGETPTVAADGDGVGVPLGWIGWFGYGMGEETTGVRLRRPGTTSPESAFMRVDRLIAIDHATGDIELLALGDRWEGELAAWRDDTARVIRSVATSYPAAHQAATVRRDDAPGDRVRWVDDDTRYLAGIAACLRFIAEGDAYQLCLTTEVATELEGDALETYLALRRSSPSHHGGLLRIGSVAMLSASPERFLGVTPEGVVETHPIKGTRPRGRTADEDRALAEELAGDEKERAENLMIVDLMRNDLGRVCRPGSVTVPSLFRVESYRHVHQLVSTVRGRLDDGLTGLDAVAACFPAGSMTGAPKIRAMQLLDGLEGRARGPYSGAFGWIGADGSVELAMTIRTIVLDGALATIGAGGGITASSVPERELAEVKLKAAALLDVLVGHVGASQL